MSAALKEDFSYWKAQLAGQHPELTDKLPRCGCYRYRGEPVLIRVVDGTMFAWIGRKDQQTRKVADASFAETTFSFFCRDAISSALYDAVANKNEPWPDAAPDVAAEMGHNLPSDPAERKFVELEAHAERVAEFLKTPISSEDDAVKCGLWSKKIDGLGKDIDAVRDAEKRPHDEAAAAVQAKFKPKVDLAKTLAKQLKGHMEAWVLAKKRKAEAEEKARLEAGRKAAESLEMPAPEPVQTRTPSKVVTGGISVRTRKVAVISDLPAAAAFYASMSEPPQQFVAIIKQMAEANLKGGVAVPGCELKTIESVA